MIQNDEFNIIQSAVGTQWLFVVSFPGFILLSTMLFLGCLKSRRRASDAYETDLLVTDNQNEEHQQQQNNENKGFISKMKKTFASKLGTRHKNTEKRQSSEANMLVRDTALSILESQQQENEKKAEEAVPKSPFAGFGSFKKLANLSFKRNPKRSIEIYVPGVDAPPPRNPNRAPSAMAPPGTPRGNFGWAAAISNRVSSVFFSRRVPQTASINKHMKSPEMLSVSIDKYPNSSLNEETPVSKNSDLGKLGEKEGSASSDIIVIRDSLNDV